MQTGIKPVFCMFLWTSFAYFEVVIYSFICVLVFCAMFFFLIWSQPLNQVAGVHHSISTIDVDLNKLQDLVFGLVSYKWLHISYNPGSTERILFLIVMWVLSPNFIVMTTFICIFVHLIYFNFVTLFISYFIFWKTWIGQGRWKKCWFGIWF